MSKDTKNVLILGSKNYGNRRILYELKQLGMSAQIVEPRHFILSISNQSGNDKIYYKGKRIYKNSIDFVISRVGNDFSTGKKVLEHLQNNLGIPCTSSALGLEMASDKFLCSQVLSSNGIKTPKSVHFKETTEYGLLKKLVGGYPFVVKLLTGSQGKGVFLINDDLAGSTALSTISKISRVCLQQYIETAKKDSKKCDLRLFVVGNEVIAAMKRFSIKSDFRSNYSISKEAINYKPTDKQKEMALAAAKALNLGICGVDIVTDIETGEDYIIEANGNPGTGIAKITGVNIYEKMALMAKNWDTNPQGELCYMPWTGNPVNLETKRKNTREPDLWMNDLRFEIDDPDPGASPTDQEPEHETQTEEFSSKMYDNFVSFSVDILENDSLMNFDNELNYSHFTELRRGVITTIQGLVNDKKY